MRRDLDGLYDRGASHGEITGSGENFDSAMEKFRKRQEALKEVGTWRSAYWNKSAGRYIDRDWDIIDY